MIKRAGATGTRTGTARNTKIAIKAMWAATGCKRSNMPKAPMRAIAGARANNPI